MASSTPDRDHGKYLKIKALDFLDRRLAGGPTSWRQLAGELNYTSIDVDKFNADGCKPDQSSTKLLLRDWENRLGGCDVEHLKTSLATIGRNDILRDILEDFEQQGKELVEPRAPLPNNAPIQCMDIPVQNNLQRMDIPVQNNLPVQPISQQGQDVVFIGKIFDGTLCMENMTFIPPRQESKSPPSGPLSANPSPLDPCDSPKKDALRSPVIEREPRLPDKAYPKRNSDPTQRNSDPTQRRDVFPTWCDSGSMDNIPSRKDSPKNMKKTQSEVHVFHEKPVIRTNASQDPSEVKKEKEHYQTAGDYGPLQSRSPNSVREAPGHDGASPVLTGKKYLLLSSDDHQDRQWCKKLSNILKKKGHTVFMLHEVQERLLSLFYEVDFVVVIYTENCKKEFQRTGTRNQLLFQHMQSEYKTKGNVNERFIPVYDADVIRQLPDALLHGNRPESSYILGLLSGNNRPCNGRCMHSSAPSHGGVGGADRATDNATPTRYNNHRSQSTPVILREYHSPPHPPKPSSTEKSEKKETKLKFFRSKNKKEK